MATAEDGTHPDIPDRQWTNPFPEDHPLHDLFHNRVKNNQDLVIIIDDYHARRGTGKTIASLQLANGMDQHGGLTWENVSMSAEEIRNAYYQLPERSGVVFDEGEIGAGNRDAMTKSNKALRDIVSMARVEEKYVVVNAPSVGFIDKDIRQMADVWITMLAKGIGLIHYYERQPYARQGSGKLLTPKKGLIYFKDVQKGTQLRNVYNRLTREKKKHIRGEEGEGFVTMGEHRQQLEKAREEARREQRNEDIVDIYRRFNENLTDEDVDRIGQHGLSQAMLGEAVGLTQQQVGNIIRDFNE